METNNNTTTSHNHEHHLMNYMQVTTEGGDNDVSAIDDLQFMDALLDNSFVDSHAEPGGSHLGAVGITTDGGQAVATGAPVVTTQQQRQQQQQQQQHQQQHQQQQQQQQLQANFGAAQVTAAAAATMPMHLPQTAQSTHGPQTGGIKVGQDKQQQQAITPSPLTARLNFAFTNPSPSSQFNVTMAQNTAAVAAAALTPAAAPVARPPVATEPRSYRKRANLSTSGRKRGRDSSAAVTEDEEEKERRRMDRNLREQQRSHKITEQISHLREVLAGANIHFKPDKYSTLVSVVDYIKQLQTRSSMLDSEHKKLIETISRTNEVVNSPYYQNGDGDPALSADLLSDAPTGSVLEDETAVFVQGLDYKNVFRQCGIALAIASIDGRFMDCNPEFEHLTGYSRDELLPGEELDSSEGAVEASLSPEETPSSSTSGVPSTVTTRQKRNLSLFNLLARHDMEQVFLAMSRMLKQPVGRMEQPTEPSGQQLDCWSGKVVQSRRDQSNVHMNVTLVRSPMGRPKFFQCALTPAA